jgi:hypothetical protein
MPNAPTRHRSRLTLEQINRSGAVVRLSEANSVRLIQPESITAAEGDGEKKLPTFEMRLYSGGIFNQWWSEYPLVLDLAGMELPNKPIPATADHTYQCGSTVGHIESVSIEDNALKASGVFSGVSEMRDQVVNAAMNGFPWQASMGATIRSAYLVKANEKVTINGREFSGPIYVVRSSKLREGAFCQLGADDDTQSTVAAMLATNPEDLTMSPEAPGSTPGTVAASAAAIPTAPAPAPAPSPEAVLAAERQRVAEIYRIAASNPDLSLRAMNEGWDIGRVQAELVRAERGPAPAPFAINPGRGTRVNAAAIAAAICLANHSPEANVIKQFGKQAVECADAEFRNIRLREIVAQACMMDGIAVPSIFGNGDAMIRAAASSISLPTILESAARRTLLDSYESHAVVALQLCAVRPVNDFKIHQRTRLLGTGKWEKVAKDGKVTHGRLGEQVYNAQADTMGEIVTLTRQNIINDDLSSFLEMFTKMGIAARNTIDFDFITMVNANAGSFYGSSNSISGGTSAFGLTGLQLLHEKFRKQEAGPGGTKETMPVNIMPRHLFVPPELEIPAAQILGSQMLVTGANQTVGSSNPFAGRYSLHSHPLLSDSSITGNSATAFYLFADPRQVAAYELSALNGVTTPTITRTAAPAGELAISFVGYIDYGISQQDPRGAAKSAGT